MGDITKHFNRADFLCHCAHCHENPARPSTKIEVIHALQAIRDMLEIPLQVSCGVRCESHNKAVGGSEQSRHLAQFADAVDIVVSDPGKAQMIALAAWASGFTVVRPYPAHIHLDARPGKKWLLAAGVD